MTQTKILVNWYKPSGKWYAQDPLIVPDDLQPYEPDNLMNFIREHQKELQPSWYDGTWFVSVTAVEQPDSDTRFFERLFKINV